MLGKTLIGGDGRVVAYTNGNGKTRVDVEFEWGSRGDNGALYVAFTHGTGVSLYANPTDPRDEKIRALESELSRVKAECRKLGGGQ